MKRAFPVAAVAVLLSLEGALALPSNIARNARAEANSQHSQDYLAAGAIDGKIPLAGSQDDAGQAWCINGAKPPPATVLSFTWSNDVKIAEAVYYARTAFFAEEGWKDFELEAAGYPGVLARGAFALGHGPQKVRLATPVITSRLTLRFLNSYGGPNPGAAEIQVYSEPMPETFYAKFRPLPRGTPVMELEDEITDHPGLADAVAAGRLGFKQLVMIRRKELNPSHVYTYHVEGFSPGGGLGIVTPDRTAVYRELIPSPEGQILDCDVSFDAKEILFSWRKTQTSGYQVFIINADGSNLRQVTAGAHHNYNACWLPDGGIAFLSTRSSRFAYCWVSPVGILHRMERDGSGVRQLSANIVNHFTPSVLEDGRIIYSRWEYVDKPAIPIQSLWTIRPDGTGLAGFYGNRVLSPATFMEARSVPGAGKVLCTLTSHNGPARGAVGLMDIRFGNNSADAIRNLTPEIPVGQVDKGDGNNIRGPYENPYPIDSRYFLVSKRGTVLVRSYEGSEQARIIAGSGGLGFYSPQPLQPRRAPPVLSSTVSLRSGSHKEEGNRFDSEVEWATVVLQDVYRGLEPHVRRGEVKEICVVEEMHKAVRTDVANRAFGFQFPVISCGATYAAKRVWGHASVAEDGSACFQVPAGRPIYFMALDAQGRAVQRMRTFTHLMPGEIQGCVGCHEPRQQTSVSFSLSQRQPEKLRPPEWGRDGFDYSRSVQPVLDRHCVRCHGGTQPAGKIDLCEDKTDFFNVSYDTLARGRRRSGEAEWESPYVDWIPTYNGMEANILEVTPKAWGSPRSRLGEVLLSGRPDSKGSNRINLEFREVRRLLTWIDLNVPYYGTSETAYPEKKGCRQILPENLESTLTEVIQRRCLICRKSGQVPREPWVRITNPQLNNFLLAPLPIQQGGNGRCGKPVFTTTSDPDYQAILKTFDSVMAELKRRPRMDMPGAKAALVDRSCLGSL